MGVPVYRRPYDAFLSHLHADEAFVRLLHTRLTETAGLNIWYDAQQMDAGDPIRTTLRKGVEHSRGLLIVGSPAAVKSNWVADEVEIAQVERNDSRDFRVIPLRLGDAEVVDLAVC